MTCHISNTTLKWRLAMGLGGFCFFVAVIFYDGHLKTRPPLKKKKKRLAQTLWGKAHFILPNWNSNGYNKRDITLIILHSHSINENTHQTHTHKKKKKKSITHTHTHIYANKKSYSDKTMATASLRTLSPNTKAYRSTSTCRSWNRASTVTVKRHTQQIRHPMLTR